MPANSYDAVIIGGGHNGLVAACYLARAGFSVCVLERYHEVGGAAFTQEIHPGFLLSEGSYVSRLMPRKIIEELGRDRGYPVSQAESALLHAVSGRAAR